MFMLSGCELTFRYEVSCQVYSVQQSDACSHYTCSNSHGRYIYQELNGQCGIFDFNSQELLIPLNEEAAHFHCMAVSEDFLVVHTKLAEGTICVYDIQNDYEQILETDHMNVCGLKADNENVFMIIQDKNTKKWDIAVTNGGDITWMGAVLAQTTPERTDETYTYYTYDGYTYVTQVSEGALEIDYIEKDDFGFSCSLTDIYIKENGELFCISRQPDFLPEYKVGYGGVAVSMLRNCQGNCYFIVQYSQSRLPIKYQENPGRGAAKRNLLCKYNLYDNSFEVLYDAKKTGQIAGFSVEASEVYIMADDGLYRKNYETNQKEKLLKTRSAGRDCYMEYYFEDCGQGFIVLSRQMMSSSEKAPRYEGYFEY